MTGVLLAAGFAVAYALFVLVRPTKVCPRCHGTMRVVRGTRIRPCKCKNGHVYRFGATAVHRFFWSIKER